MQNSVPARDWCRNLNAPSKHLTRERLSGIILLLAPNKCTDQEPWCSGLTCLPVTQKIAGSNPVGSGRFRDHAQDPRGILGMSFSSSLASNEASCGHTLTVGHAGEKVALLAQLRLPLETSSISIQPKEISLPCSSFTPFFFRSRNGY